MTVIYSQLTFKKEQWNKYFIYKAVSYLYLFYILLHIKRPTTCISIKHKMCPEFSMFMNHQQTNGPDSPRYYITIVSRRNNQTNFLDVEWKPGTLFLSVAGDCHNMAGTLCITHPIKMFSLNSVNYSLIIRSNPSLFLLTYLIVIQYTNNYETLL